MKAALHVGKNLINVEDVPEPETLPGHIKVKIAYCGICGSDIEILEERFGLMKDWPKGPAIRGHESCGTIVEVGSDCRQGYKVGQRVAMNFRGGCGVCYYCCSGMDNFCQHEYNATGGFAQYAVYREDDIFVLPDDMDFKIGALLEPVSVAVHTIDRANITPGKTVLISGAGPIGLLALQMAIKAGAARVAVSEPLAEKRAIAQKMGADITIDPLKENLMEVCQDFTGGLGFDSVIECSGNVGAATQSVNLAGKGGTVVWASVYPEDKGIEVNAFHMYAYELTISSVFLSPYCFNRALKLLPKMDLEPLITDIYPLDDIVKAFEYHHTGSPIKILIKCNP